MPRNNDAARTLRVLEYVMAAAVTLDPPFPLEPRYDFRPVRFGLGHGRRSMRKYWRIFDCQSIDRIGQAGRAA
jgi:hypothetical protein